MNTEEISAEIERLRQELDDRRLDIMTKQREIVENARIKRNEEAKIKEPEVRVTNRDDRAFVIFQATTIVFLGWASYALYTFGNQLLNQLKLPVPNSVIIAISGVVLATIAFIISDRRR